MRIDRHIMRIRAALVIGFLVGFGEQAFGARLSARLDPDAIYLGTQTLLMVEVTDAPGAGWPAVTPVEGVQITRYGSPSLVRDLLGGTVRRSYRFLVSPQRAGEFVIKSVSLKVGQQELQDGPFRLRVVETPLKFLAIEMDPAEVLVGQTATMKVSFQGYRPGAKLTVPEVAGLSIESAGDPQIEVMRRTGMPVTSYQYRVTASRLGTYIIEGIALEQTRADPVTLEALSFVVVASQVGEQSLVVGGQTSLHVAIRGLPASAKLKPVVPPGLKASPYPGRSPRGPAGTEVFSFVLTPTEPGTPTISELQLPDGQKIPLSQPVSLSVRQAGEGGILSCRGIPRSEETVLGQPFVVDYEVYFRGDLRDAVIDLSTAGFANKSYVKVEPVSPPSYDGWTGQPMQVGIGDAQMTVLVGNGDFNGRKEQLLRFSLRITPLAAGDLSLDGLRVVLLLYVKEEHRTAVSFFSSSRTERYDQVAEVPPYHVLDPPGKAAPPGYRGAVGTSFAFVTELDRTTATAMSPLTLTMKITGESVGVEFQPPLLNTVDELTRDFDVSSTIGGGDVEGTTITFTQVVRPRHERVTELPALPLVYYNYQADRYETVYSLPIPLEVRPGGLVGAGQMALATPNDTASGDRELGSDAPVARTLGANYTTLGQVAMSDPLGPGGVLAVLAGGPLCIGLVLGGRRFYQRRRPMSEIRRQRANLTTTLRHLAGSDDFHAQLAQTLQGYLRLTFDLPPGELSADMLEAAFEERPCDDGLMTRSLELLAECNQGRFASAAVDDHEKKKLIDRTRQLFVDLDRGVK